MESQLNKKELEEIARMVSENLHAKFIADGSQKELQAATENYTKQMIRKMLKPIFDDYLKENGVIEEALRYYMNSDTFKKIELSHLERYCHRLREELENEHA